MLTSGVPNELSARAVRRGQGRAKMADVITFSCPQCQMPYRVANAHAGRAFACKNCNHQLFVPHASIPPGAVVVPQEPEVQLDAGQQVIRKTDSARRATVDPTRMITRNSGAHPAVVPPAGSAPGTKPKSKTPLLVAVVGGLVLIGAVAGMYFGNVFGSGHTAPAPNGPVADANGPATPVKNEAAERDQILQALNAPGRTGPEMIGLYKRAVAAKLERPDVSMVVREAVERIHSENGQGLTDDAILDFGELLAADKYTNEPARMYLLVAKRWLGKPDTPASFARAQKLRKLEKLDFQALLTRADEVVQTGVIDAAHTLREELVKLSDASENGWVETAVAERVAVIDKELVAHQAEVERLRAEDPFAFVAAKARNTFKGQRVSTRSTWSIHVSDPVLIYCERRKGETEEADRLYYLALVQGVEQFVRFYRDEFAKPMGLKRVLPMDITDESERELAPLEILVFHDRATWRPYLSDMRARVDTSRLSHHTDHGSGRLSYVYDGTQTSMVNLVTMLTYHCIDTWHPRVKETKDKPAFKTFVIETIMPAAISLYETQGGGEDARYTFFRPDTRWQRQMATWRKPFAAQPNNSIDSFGGPGVTLRDMIKMQSAGEFVDAFEKNIKTYAGWEEERIKTIASSMRSPNSPALNTVLSAYFRGFAMFLWHFEKDGKPKYRDGFRKYLLADLQGAVTGPNQEEEFAKALGLNEAGWKEIEADFLTYQTAP